MEGLGKTWFSSDASSSLDDYAASQHTSGSDVDLVAMEVKVQGSWGGFQEDRKKMKSLLDSMIHHRISEPRIHGILAEGFNNFAYSMKWQSVIVGYGKFELAMSPGH
ncbi:hypothetical protein BJV82DRAFT_671743 [Fennellomyces sp. T-0311]|nr:hypothetical protein BJV82DRAFT_671743 [Fennellomyces sp. T-0311]